MEKQSKIMEKNAQPFSEPYGVKFAFTEDLSSFVMILGKVYTNFKPDRNWHSIPEVPGTLKPTTTPSDASKNPVYSISHRFRVSFASIDNRNELEQYVGRPIIMSYTSAGGKQRLSGSKQYPLYISVAEPEGFDGFEITVTGVQTFSECFI